MKTEDINRREEEIKAAKNEEKPIVMEFNKLGIDIVSLSQIINYDIEYKDAIPVLLDWLPLVKTPGVKETIVRALTTKWAKPDAAPLLIELFKDQNPDYTLGMKFAICNALYYTSDESHFDDIVEIALDPNYGHGRAGLASVIRKMKNPDAKKVLIQLLDDENFPVSGQALKELRKKPTLALGAEEKIKKFLNHTESWVRKEARLALEKIERLKE